MTAVKKQCHREFFQSLIFLKKMFDMENVLVQIKQLVLNLQKGEMEGEKDYCMEEGWIIHDI